MRSRAARERDGGARGGLRSGTAQERGRRGKERFAGRDCAGEGRTIELGRNKNPLYNAGCEVIFFYIIVSKNCRL